MNLALKIDVATLSGTLEGVPRLVELLQRSHARATFLFTLGAHHPLHCRWLPGPDIGRRCAPALHAADAAGFETGIHAYDHAKWLHAAAHQDAAWTRRQMELACNRYQEIFGKAARVHGAAGWQMNVHAFRLTQRLGFQFASDTRGSHPFLPVHNAEVMACPQLPTTLPTLSELLAGPGMTPDTAVAHLLQASADAPPAGHVYAASAEREGRAFPATFARLIEGWRSLGYRLVALGDYGAALNPATLPYHNIARGHVAGRRGAVAVQGEAFLA